MQHFSLGQHAQIETDLITGGKISFVEVTKIYLKKSIFLLWRIFSPRNINYKGRHTAYKMCRATCTMWDMRRFDDRRLDTSTSGTLATRESTDQLTDDLHAIFEMCHGVLFVCEWAWQ